MKQIAVLEITNSVIRLVVGNVIDDVPVIIYSCERHIDGFISKGEILNNNGLVSVLSKMKLIEDESISLKLKIDDVTLVIPPIGLEVFAAEKTTNVVSPASIIEKIDIQNILSLVQKGKITNGSEIVDIVPDVFILENGSKYSTPPLGQKSNLLMVEAKVHAIPSRIVSTYKSAVESAGIRVRRIVVSTYGISDLFAKLKIYSPNYLLVDIGAEQTTLSLVGNNTLYCSNIVLLGGNDLTRHIADAFETDVENAEIIKKRYGFVSNKLDFNPTVSSRLNQFGDTINYTPNDLQRAIEEFFTDTYFKQIHAGIATLLNGYDEATLRLPIIFTGGGICLKGIRELIEKEFSENSKIDFYESKYIGARDAKFTATIGALCVSARFKGSLSDQRSKVSQLERVEQPATSTK